MGYVKTYIFILLLSISLTAQSGSIETENAKLDKLQNEISTLQSELKNLSAEEENTYGHLEKLKKEELLINKILNELNNEEKKLSSSISSIMNKIEQNEQKIEYLRDSYEKYVVWLYKKGDKSELNYYLNSGTIKDLYVRYKNMDYLHEAYKDMQEELKEAVSGLTVKKSDLEIAKRKKAEVIVQKEEEIKTLSANRKEKETLIGTLKKDKNNIRKEIEEKQKAQLAIKDLIANLVKNTEKRKEAVTTEEKENIPVFSYTGDEKIDLLKGRLEWPVFGGSILRKFGNTTNPKLKTVTVNYGVDITAVKHDNVRAVASGVVSAIDWIPGYGSIIIVSHNDDYRTVYGHVNEITVKEGDDISAGDQIAKVSDGIEGKVLHFEVWNGRKNENPESWLKK